MIMFSPFLDHVLDFGLFKHEHFSFLFPLPCIGNSLSRQTKSQSLTSQPNLRFLGSCLCDCTQFSSKEGFRKRMTHYIKLTRKESIIKDNVFYSNTISVIIQYFSYIATI